MIARTFEPDRDESVARNTGGAGKGGLRRDGLRRDGLQRDGLQRDGLQRDGGGSKSLSRRVRRLVSVLLVLHLVAIASAPLAMEPASLPAQKVFAFFRPYLDAAFLNHGYHFFAPEPGPSHLIRYQLTFADGRIEDGVFPDSAEQKPRLNYHRHFMLSEFANRLAVDDSQQPALHELSQSFARHLMSERDAESATLFLRRHYIPSPQQVRDGMTLAAEELYAERPLGTFWSESDSALVNSALVRPAASAVGSENSPQVQDQRGRAAVRLTGRLYLPGDLQAGEVIR
jgi:hypothetical protein